MASKVKKGFLYYLVWILVIVLGVFCLLASILIFNPGKDVLGLNFKFVSDSKSYNVNQLEVGGTKQFLKQLPISKVNFDGGFTDFKITQNNDYEQVTIMVKKNISGFSSSDKITHEVSISYESGELNISVTEPELSMGFSKIASVTLFCPASYSFQNYEFNIKTISGAISLGNTGLYKPNLGSVNIETQTGSIYIAETCNIVSGKAYIESKNSNINIDADIRTKLEIETDASKVEINKISGDLTISANELKAKCGTILGNVQFSSLKGYIEIKELGNILTKTNGNFSGIIDTMYIANVMINKMAGSLDLPKAKESNITIGEIYGTAFARTTTGDVNISKAYGEIDIITQSGSVDTTKLGNSRTYIESDSGKITINFADIGTTDLITNKADIVVNLKENLNAYIDYTNAKNISISWIKSSLEKDGFVETPEYEESTAAKFNVKTKTSGNIYIKNTYIPN